MKKFILMFLGMLALSAMAAVPLADRENLINTSWQFSRDQANWQEVAVPHDFSITGPFGSGNGLEAESGCLPGGTGYYRRKFTVAAEKAGSRILLEFDAVYQHATVKVNGTEVGQNHYGYNNFILDVTDQTVCDGETRNVIEVTVVANTQSSRWYSGAGIESDVKLHILPATHIVRDGAFIFTPELKTNSSSGLARAQIETANTTDASASVKTRVTICEVGSSSALATATSEAFAVGAGATVTNSVDVNYVGRMLWSPANPHRYQAKIELLDANDAVIDTQYEIFGYCWAERDANTGLKWNGENLKLFGVDLHHDLGAMGAAFNEGLWEKRLLQLKDMGVNAVRTGHNPYPKRFIGLCGKLGILLLDEFFDGWYAAKNFNSNDFSAYFETEKTTGYTWAHYVVDQIVRRDRNSPAILCWDIGNEIQEGVANGAMPNDAKAGATSSNLCAWVAANDPTRRTTIGDNTWGGNSLVDGAIVAAGGWIGANYAKQHTANRIPGMISGYGAFLETESCSAVNGRGFYKYCASTYDDDGKYRVCSYDMTTVSWGCLAREGILAALSTDQMMGQFIWTGFDYIGEPTPWNAANGGIAGANNYLGTPAGQAKYPNSSYFGRIDTCGFEKDSYYLYRSQWKRDGHTLHLVGGWTAGNQATDSNGKAIIWVYADVPRFELYLGSDKVAHATRVTSAATTAGYTYYTWDCFSDSADCTVIERSEDYEQLAAGFNITMDGRVLTAKAFDGVSEIESGIVGRTKLAAPNASKTIVVTADAPSSLAANSDNIVRFEIDVKDSTGQLDLENETELAVTLSGNGEIVGVDNGNPASLRKYQVATALAADRQSATVDAHAGKALVLVRATDAGEVTLDVTGSGLTSGSANFTATAKTETLDPWPEPPVALLNVALATTVNKAPTLPATVKGISSLGEVEGDYAVTWDAVTDSQFTTLDSVVTVNGSATVNGNAMSVTAKVRVGEVAGGNGENIVAGVVPTCPHRPNSGTSNHSGQCANLTDGSNSNTWDTWTRYNDNGYVYSNETFVLTFDLGEAKSAHLLKMFHANEGQRPTAYVAISGSADNSNWTTPQKLTPEDSTANQSEYDYTLNSDLVNVRYLRVYIGANPDGSESAAQNANGFTKLTELEIYSPADSGSVPLKSDATLSSIAVNTTNVTGFASNVRDYEFAGGETVTGVTVTDGASYTIIQPTAANKRAYIVTLSEDGQTSYTYTVLMTPPVDEPVAGDVFVLRNIAAVTVENTQPTLPDHVWSLTTEGETNELVAVNWTMPAASEFTTVESPVVVQGTVTTEDGSKTVTASVRVASAGGNEENYAGSATGTIDGSNLSNQTTSRISDPIAPPPGASDMWGNPQNLILQCGAANKEFTITDVWTDEKTVSKVRICYLDSNWSTTPDVVEFYSDAECQAQNKIASGTGVFDEFVLTSKPNETNYWYTYTFDSPQTVSTLVGKFKNTVSQSVVVRFWPMGGGTTDTTPKTNDQLNALTTTGATLTGFDPATYNYTVEDATAIATATAAVNTGITILPKSSATSNAYAVTVAENGTATRKYTVYMPASEPVPPQEKPFALRNIAAVTMVGTPAELPATVKGLDATGEVMGDYAVVWSTNSSTYASAGTVEVTGTATINAEQMTVKASVRIVQGGGETIQLDPNNVTITGSASGSYGNATLPGALYFNSIADYNTTDVWQGKCIICLQATSLRADYTWSTPVKIDKVVTYCYKNYKNAADSQNFYANGSSTPIVISEVRKETVGNFFKNEYIFASPVMASTLQLNVYGDNQTLLYRLWPVGSAGGDTTPKTNDLLATLTTAPVALENFAASTYSYTVEGATEISGATATENTGITILPKNAATTNAYVVTLAENGTATRKYSVYMPESTACQHDGEKIVHPAVPSTCTTHGTNTWQECAICGHHITEPEEQPLAAHTLEDIPAVSATCTTAGSHGGKKCSVCNEVVTQPTVDAALGHDWDAGVITTPATEEHDGEKTFTCQRQGCGVTSNEVIPRVVSAFALRNIATVVAASDGAAALPDKVWGLTATGETNALFDVVWTNNTAGRFSAAGTVMVGGYATVGAEQKGVTASVRVEQAQQGGGELVYLSDTLTLESDGTQWTSWKYRITHDFADPYTDGDDWGWNHYLVNSGAEVHTDTLSWDAAYDVSLVTNIYYVSGAYMLPGDVQFYADSACEHPIAYTASTPVDCVDTRYKKIVYEIAQHPASDHLYIKYTIAGPNKNISLCRLWVYAGGRGSSGGGVTPKTNDQLATLTTTPAALENFAPTTYSYTVTNATAISAATASENTGITILPLNASTTNAYVVTVSEDDAHTAKYSVYMPESCRHPETNDIPAVAATCTQPGLGVGKQCAVCGRILVPQVETSPALGHDLHETISAIEATLEHAGRTAQIECSRCDYIEQYSEVIPQLLPITALRNISTCTDVGVAPTLPATVKGLTSIGEPSGDYPVVWADNDAGRYTTEGTLVTVHGTSEVGGSVLPVTASVRIGALVPEQTNLAAGHTPSCPDKNSSLASLVNGNTSAESWGSWTRYGTNPNYVYSNENFTITFPLGGTQTVRSMKIYFNAGSLPNHPVNGGKYAPYLAIESSADGSSWSSVAYTAEYCENNLWNYEFGAAQRDVTHIRIVIGVNIGGERAVLVDSKDFTYVKLNEVEIMGDAYAQTIGLMDSPALSDLAVNGVTVSGFSSTAHETLYKFNETPATTNLTAASASKNAAVTVLPIWTNDVAYVVSLSEDGSEQWVWQVLFCKHEHSTRYGGHDPTCETLGDTGTLVCNRCGHLLEATQAIPALGHDWGEWTENIAPTAAAMGDRSHVCGRCGKCEHDALPALPGNVPALLMQEFEPCGDNVWKVTGIIQDFGQSGYYVPEKFGFVLFEKTALGERALTVNTPGRTKVTFDPRNVTIVTHQDKNGVDHVCGDYVYRLKYFQEVGTFMVRPWMLYRDNEGIPRYGYGTAFELDGSALPTE